MPRGLSINNVTAAICTILTEMSRGLSDNVQTVMSLFAKYDVNQDGGISKEELTKMLLRKFQDEGIVADVESVESQEICIPVAANKKIKLLGNLGYVRRHRTCLTLLIQMGTGLCLHLNLFVNIRSSKTLRTPSHCHLQPRPHQSRWLSKIAAEV